MHAALNAFLTNRLHVSHDELELIDEIKKEQYDEQQSDKSKVEAKLPPVGVVVEVSEAPHPHMEASTAEAGPIVNNSMISNASTTVLPDDAPPPPTTPATILKEVAMLALPTTAVYFLIFINQTVTLMFVGRLLGTEQLAGYALGNSIFNVVGLTLTIGVASTITTLASQAYGRNPEGDAVAKEYQKGLYICLGLCAIPSLIFQFIEPLTVYFFGDPLGVYAAEFLRIAPVQLVVIIWNVTMTRSLQAQRLPQLSIKGTLASTIACPFLCHYMAPYGITYAVLAISASLAVQAIITIVEGIYHPKCVIFNCKWPLADDVLTKKSVKKFLSLGLPMAVAGSAEGWAFEAQVFVATRLNSTTELAALNICFSMLAVFFGVPIGSSSAAATFTGNFLGAGKPRAVLTYLKFVATWAIFCSSIVATSIFFFGSFFVRAYTDDPNTLYELETLIPLLALFHFIDAIELPVQGVFRGAGRQTHLFRVMVTGLWLFQFPIGAFLTLNTSLRVAGVLVGFIMGYMVVLPWMVKIIKSWSFEELAKEASARAEADALKQPRMPDPKVQQPMRELSSEDQLDSNRSSGNDDDCVEMMSPPPKPVREAEKTM